MKQKLLLFLSLFLLIGGGNVWGVNHVLELTTNNAKANAWEWGIKYELSTPLKKGKSYILTMKINTSDDSFKSLSFWPNEGNNTQYLGLPVSKEFKTQQLNFDATYELKNLVFNFGSLNGRLTIDDIVLKESGTDTNLIEDGDFESGNGFAGGWKFEWNKPLCYGIVEEYVLGQNHYLEIKKEKATSNHWDRNLTYNLSTPLEKGQTYVLTMKSKSSCTWENNTIPFWPYCSRKQVLFSDVTEYNKAKGTSLTEEEFSALKVEEKVKTAAGATKYTGIGISDDWVEQTCEFTANDDLDVITFKLGKLAGDLCVDNIKIVKKGTSKNLVPNGSDFEGGNFPASGWYMEIGYQQEAFDFAQIVAGGYEDFKATAIPTTLDIRTAPWYKNSKGETAATEGKDYVLCDNTTANGANYNVNKETDAYYAAYWGGENLNYYADLTAYKTLRVYQENGDNIPRVFFINTAKTGHQQVTGFVWNEEGKYYEFDLALADKAVGNRKLTTLRPTGKGTCTGIALTNGVSCNGYKLTGDAENGTVTESVTAALNDVSATYYDATGLTNTTKASLKVANPNAIIAAKAGILTNDNNVAIDGRVESLALTDGYSFQAPENMKATKAQYTRESNTKYGTIVLPFNGSSADVKFYEIKNMTEEAIVLEEVTELAAGIPAIIEKTTDRSEIVITGVEGNITNVTEVSKADGAVMMHGSYTQGTTVTDANSYYIMGDKFYSINDNFVCNAFRGYFTTVNSTAAARLAIITDNNVTGVNSVENQENANTIVEVYNAAGVQQKGMQKGVNIARLANGKTVTVIVK